MSTFVALYGVLFSVIEVEIGLWLAFLAFIGVIVLKFFSSFKVGGLV
jgi:hypothetical protein